MPADTELIRKDVEKGSRWIVAAHISRAKNCGFGLQRFNHERDVDILKENGLWDEESSFSVIC